MDLAETAQRLLRTINPFAKKIHLAVIYVEYDRGKSTESDRVFALLQGYLSTMENCRITYIRVDNRYEDMPVSRLASNVYLAGGDNSFREFSGWQKGIAALNTLGCRYDLALITNEMFLKPGPSFLQDYATDQLLKKSLFEHKVIGRIDTTFQEYTLFGHDVSSWVCTNCVFIPKKAVAALGGFALINDNIHEILPRTYDPSHLLLSRRTLAQDAHSGDFCIELELDASPGARNEIRIQFGLDSVNQTPLANEEGVGIALLSEALVNDQPLPRQAFIRGVVQDDLGNLHASRTLLLALPEIDASPSRLTIKGSSSPWRPVIKNLTPFPLLWYIMTRNFFCRTHQSTKHTSAGSLSG